MSTGKDSPEAVVFMAKFKELKNWSDDTPDELIELAVKDVSVKDLCVQVDFTAVAFKQDELRSPEPFVAPVSPAFQKAWRDYEKRYEHVVDLITLMDLFVGPGEPISPATSYTNDLLKAHKAAPTEFEDSWAQNLADDIDAAIQFAQDMLDHIDDDAFQDRIQNGCDAYGELMQNIGFDARGVFRRRALFPKVLIPRHVAKRHGSAEQHSLYTHLQQEHDAFIYGAPYAALALVRSILEKILRDHYGAKGVDLNELINQAFQFRRQQSDLRGDLHHIRKLANTILHWDRDEREKEKKFFSGKFDEREQKMRLLFLALRKLIEEAPEYP